jgi:acetyl-CoA/propionyl-CoA carboxylase carboxyl transferase subunit
MTASVPPALPGDPVVRLTALFDAGTLSLLSEVDDSGAVAATGLIDGLVAVAFASDRRVQGGASGAAGCDVIVGAYEEAVARGVPVIGLWHSGGARIAEGVSSLDGVGRIFAAMTMASGVIPQISVVLGPAAGGGAYGPALTDIVILSNHGRIFVTGPDVVRSVTGEDVDIDMARLGGPEPHSRRSGVVHLVAPSDDDALGYARSLVTLLSEQGKVSPDSVAGRDLSGILPESARRAYDVHALVSRLLDSDSAIELHPRWAPNVVTILGRFAGRTVGVVANNPMRLGGCLDAASAEKAARFVRFCDAFGVPLIVLVDVPGYLPGVGQEWDGVVRRGAKLLHAFAECVVPRVTVVTRKAIGGAYIAMNSRALGATRVYAWPEAEVAVTGSVAAIRILKKRHLATVPAEKLAAEEAALAAEHEATVGGLHKAVELGVVDEVITPAATAAEVAAAIAAAPEARGTHGNIPL